ncbi:MAG: hypothetical protein JO276_14985 [Sphingomonadaceae bacterium]|nr:hypothetical protein [Sphingomonadaceae bacterium]
MKELLLDAKPDPGRDFRLAAAASLAKRLGGHIACRLRTRTILLLAR